MMLKAPFDLATVQPEPQYTRHNPDPFNNHYRATIRVGMRVLHWSSYDADHLNARIDAAGYRPFVTCWTVEGA